MKVYHAKRTRSNRVIWMLEEMGLDYEVHTVPFPPTSDPDYMAFNPQGTLPAFVDGDVLLFESMAIVEYIGHKHGPTPLIVGPDSPGYAPYLQFFHLGEATLAASLTPLVRTRFGAPEEEKRNWTAREIERVFNSRLGLVDERLAQAPYLAGDDFTAADISVGYALSIAVMLRMTDSFTDAVKDYWRRLKERPAYLRMLEK